MLAFGVTISKATDVAVVFDETCDFRVSQQGERREAAGLPGHELEKVPLRHERDEGKSRRNPLERNRERLTGCRLQLHAPDSAMRQLQELVSQAELVHQLQRRRVNGVAAEVAEKVAVFLENDDVDARAREQKPEKCAGRRRHAASVLSVQEKGRP